MYQAVSDDELAEKNSNNPEFGEEPPAGTRLVKTHGIFSTLHTHYAMPPRKVYFLLLLISTARVSLAHVPTSTTYPHR